MSVDVAVCLLFRIMLTGGGGGLRSLIRICGDRFLRDCAAYFSSSPYPILSYFIYLSFIFYLFIIYYLFILFILFLFGFLILRHS